MLPVSRCSPQTTDPKTARCAALRLGCGLSSDWAIVCLHAISTCLHWWERVLSPMAATPIILNPEDKQIWFPQRADKEVWGGGPWIQMWLSVQWVPTSFWWQKLVLEENYLPLCGSDSVHNRSTRSLNFKLPTPLSSRVVLFDSV